MNGRDFRSKWRKSRCCPRDGIRGRIKFIVMDSRNTMASMACHPEVMDGLFRLPLFCYCETPKRTGLTMVSIPAAISSAGDAHWGSETSGVRLQKPPRQRWSLIVTRLHREPSRDGQALP